MEDHQALSSRHTAAEQGKGRVEGSIEERGRARLPDLRMSSARFSSSNVGIRKSTDHIHKSGRQACSRSENSQMKLHAEIGDTKHEIEIKREDGKVFADVDGRIYELEVSEPES